MKKFNITVRYGRTDAFGFGAALVFTEGIVLAFGLWCVEIDW